MILADAVEDVGQQDLRVKAIDPGCLERKLHLRHPLAAAVRAVYRQFLRPNAISRSAFSARLLSIAGHPFSVCAKFG